MPKRAVSIRELQPGDVIKLKGGDTKSRAFGQMDSPYLGKTCIIQSTNLAGLSLSLADNTGKGGGGSLETPVTDRPVAFLTNGYSTYDGLFEFVSRPSDPSFAEIEFALKLCGGCNLQKPEQTLDATDMCPGCAEIIANRDLGDVEPVYKPAKPVPVNNEVDTAGAARAYLASKQVETVAQPSTEETQVQELVNWISDHVQPDTHLLVPVSGGTDSALAFYLCTKALGPGRVLGVMLSHNGKQLPEALTTWFNTFGGKFSGFAVKATEQPEVARWYHLQLMAQPGTWLVSTRNRTEQELGTYSAASEVAKFKPLIGLWKTDVIKLCRYLGVPESVISSSYEPDLECGRTAELAKLLEIDLILQGRPGRLDPVTAKLVKETQDRNAWKR